MTRCDDCDKHVVYRPLFTVFDRFYRDGCGDLLSLPSVRLNLYRKVHLCKDWPCTKVGNLRCTPKMKAWYKGQHCVVLPRYLFAEKKKERKDGA